MIIKVAKTGDEILRGKVRMKVYGEADTLLRLDAIAAKASSAPHSEVQ